MSIDCTAQRDRTYVASSAFGLLHILYDNHEMLASEVTTSHAQAVEKPCAGIAGALKDEVWRRDGDLYIFQIATDLGMGSQGIIAGLSMPCRSAKHDGCTFIIGGLKHIFGLETHQESSP